MKPEKISPGELFEQEILGEFGKRRRVVVTQQIQIDDFCLYQQVAQELGGVTISEVAQEGENFEFRKYWGGSGTAIVETGNVAIAITYTGELAKDASPFYARVRELEQEREKRLNQKEGLLLRIVRNLGSKF